MRDSKTQTPKYEILQVKPPPAPLVPQHRMTHHSAELRKPAPPQIITYSLSYGNMSLQHLCTYVHIYIHTHICIYVCVYYRFIYLSIYIYTHIYIYIYIYIYTYIYTYIYIYTHTYIYICVCLCITTLVLKGSD